MICPDKRVTLLSDFGYSDGYVTAMKGVICSECAGVTIIDACHRIPAQDIRHASWVLQQYINLYPKGTLHVAVIDPGVGSDRRIIAGTIDGQYVIVPDNGMLDLVLQKASSVDLWRLRSDWHRAEGCSTTFHGRDIFAYTAGKWMNGTPRHVFAVEPAILSSQSDGLFKPAVVTWDHFGNIITNITQKHVPEGCHVSAVTVGAHRITAMKSYYAEVNPGEWLVLFGSDGFIEISVCNGSAKDLLGSTLKKGQPITMEFGRNEKT